MEDAESVPKGELPNSERLFFALLDLAMIGGRSETADFTALLLDLLDFITNGRLVVRDHPYCYSIGQAHSEATPSLAIIDVVLQFTCLLSSCNIGM
jgi:hypothetical protein